MKVQSNSIVLKLNTAVRDCRDIGEEGDDKRVHVREGVVLLDGLFVAKNTEDGLMIGVPNGNLRYEAIQILNFLNGVQVIRTGKQHSLNGKSWDCTLTYVDGTDGSWKYKED